MRFHILDVGHGQCAYLWADNGNVMMFDCGHSADPEFRPSAFLSNLGISSIQRLFISNYDEDHISDLPELRRLHTIGILHRNRSITPGQLRALKRQGGPISWAMESLLEMKETYNVTAHDMGPPEFTGVSWHNFWAHYGTHFDDTNNLSLVTFLHLPRLNVLIPGDLEEQGWLHHLRDQSFRHLLGQVDVMIASHHGRESGYCGEVFKYCRPRLIVFSDSAISYATQEMAGAYYKHSSGMRIGEETRFVFSTRSDGDVYWDL